MSAPTTPESRATRGASEEGSPGALRTPWASQLAGDEQSPASTKDYGECANFGAPPTLEGTAYAEKWRLWVLRNWHSDKPSSIPEKHRNKVYVECDSEGTYCVNKVLRDARMQLTRANRNAQAP